MIQLKLLIIIQNKMTTDLQIKFIIVYKTANFKNKMKVFFFINYKY